MITEWMHRMIVLLPKGKTMRVHGIKEGLRLFIPSKKPRKTEAKKSKWKALSQPHVPFMDCCSGSDGRRVTGAQTAPDTAYMPNSYAYQTIRDQSLLFGTTAIRTNRLWQSKPVDAVPSFTVDICLYVFEVENFQEALVYPGEMILK